MFTKSSTAAVLLGLVSASGALANPAPGTQFVYVPVLDVEPVVRVVTVTRPREECWLETRVVPTYPNTTGPVIAGGLIGGIIGHQFGSGRGNDAMTVLGTLVGSAIASDVVLRRHGPPGDREVTAERCEIVSESHQEERIESYLVTYEYLGQRYQTQMPHPPREDRVRLRVTVHAAGY